MSVAEQLERLQGMREQGLITESEYHARRAELLGGGGSTNQPGSSDPWSGSASSAWSNYGYGAPPAGGGAGQQGANTFGGQQGAGHGQSSWDRPQHGLPPMHGQPSYGQPSYGQPMAGSPYGAAAPPPAYAPPSQHYPQGSPFGSHPYAQGPMVPLMNPTGYAPPPPPSTVVQSILVMLFCFMPGGVAALIYSINAQNSYNSGKFDEALRASTVAQRWINGSVIGGVSLAVLYFILLIMLGL